MAQSTAPPLFFSFLLSRSRSRSRSRSPSPSPSPKPVANNNISLPPSRSSLPICSSAALPICSSTSLPSLHSSNAIRTRRPTHADSDAHAHPDPNPAIAYQSQSQYQKLEEDMFQFMNNSNKPHVFPTHQELIQAGRKDLADAVAAQGGWLAFGWDLDLPPPSASASALPHANKATYTADTADTHPQVSGGSGTSMDEEESSDNTGLEGMLKRIEKQRSLAKDRKIYSQGQSSHNNRDLDPGERAPFNNKHPLKINKMGNKPNYLSLQGEAFHDYCIISPKNGKSPISNGSANPSTSDRWTRLNLRNDNSSSNEIEAGITVLTEEKTIPDSDTLKDDFDNGMLPNNGDPSGSRGMAKESSLEMGDIRQRINQLESSLNSALDSVRSRVKKVLSHEIDENTAVTLDNLSDDWEFRETEILKTKDEVRSLRARISVIEGKMALQIIEAQKLMEENQKKLDEARRHLSSLRNISVVWPNPASEVLLAGSFDGWTSKRSMEKSGEGIFSLNLMLYPGKYEIKFIVDGVWTVDPLRPVVKYSGHENNLLTVV